MESSAHLGAQVPHDARHDDAGAREDEQVEETTKRDPVIASYTVDVTIRGSGNIVAPTIKQLEADIEGQLGEWAGGGTTVRATARRTD